MTFRSIRSPLLFVALLARSDSSSRPTPRIQANVSPITVSSGEISKASAKVRLVWVGLKTPGFRRMGNGPVRPFHSISVTDWLIGTSTFTSR